MKLIDKEDYRELAIILSRMAMDFEGARDVAQGFVSDKDDCILIRDAVLANEDEEEPWVGLMKQLRVSCGDAYRDTLTVAMQICNEWDAKVIADRESDYDRQEG